MCPPPLGWTQILVFFLMRASCYGHRLGRNGGTSLHQGLSCHRGLLACRCSPAFPFDSSPKPRATPQTPRVLLLQGCIDWHPAPHRAFCNSLPHPRQSSRTASRKAWGKNNKPVTVEVASVPSEKRRPLSSTGTLPFLPHKALPLSSTWSWT